MNTYPTQAQDLSAGDTVLLLVFTILWLAFVVVMYAIVSILLGRIFKKAGQPQWKAWVPVYNQWTLLQLGGKPGWWALVMLIPIVQIVGIVMLYISMYNIGLKLQKSGAFVLWAIFFPLVWYVWLAVDKSVWDDKAGDRRLDTPVAPVAVVDDDVAK